jgi:hypothetical protein
MVKVMHYTLKHGVQCIQVLQYDVSKIICHFFEQKYFIQPTTTQLWTIITLESAQTKAT